VTTDDQRDVISFLSTPVAYGRSASPVERIDTHISIVWLAGERAYKLKRAVRFDYVDFSTIELRRLACEAEVRVNRRTAPSLYLGVRPVTREAGGALALGGEGEPIDWVVEMVRFDQDTLFDRLAERHRLDAGLMEGLADAIHRLHASAKPRPDRGGRDGMAWVIDGNARGFAEQGAGILDATACERLTAASRAALDRHGGHLDARQHDRLVRECHGDLHLRNICLVDGVPTLFDAVEFNDDISCIDVLYDLAFLLMDLWRRDLRSHANLVFNECLARSGDVDGLALLPLFLSCRAAVRAKTSASAARVQPDERQRLGLQAASREYLALAQDLLRPGPPCLIAIGGLSGSGKSTLARRLAPPVGAAPGALVVRSDVIRKTLCGVSPLTRLGPEGYTADVNRRVYGAMAAQAAAALQAGHSVIADAVFARPDDREAIAAKAKAAGAPFTGLWIDGPREILAARLRERVADASDATPDVLDLQARTAIGPLDPLAGSGSSRAKSTDVWHRLDGSGDAESVQHSAEKLHQPSIGC
jgi:aminoglycoside phosphotransferase family enzyme/predicted kinase